MKFSRFFTLLVVIALTACGGSSSTTDKPSKLDINAVKAATLDHPSVSEVVLDQLQVTEKSGYVEIRFNSIEIGRSVAGENALLALSAGTKIKNEVATVARLIGKAEGVKDVTVVDSAY